MPNEQNKFIVGMQMIKMNLSLFMKNIGFNPIP